MNTAQNADQIAEWVYRDSAYPNTYRKLVAASRAKKDQYRQLASLLPEATQEVCLTILEPGPSNVPLLKNAMQALGLPINRYRLIGLDKFPNMHSDSLNVLTASVTEIPLSDSSVDVVVMSSVLFFISNQQRAISECTRVLRPGGMIILSEPDANQTSTLSRMVLAYEFAKLRAEIEPMTPRWAGDLIYHYRAAKTLVPRLPYLFAALSINKRMLAQSGGNVGFTQHQLLNLLAHAGLTVTLTTRSYADAYFLIVGQKLAEEAQPASSTL
jgi:ubiquinone/menaquinone biosynthesis C-methylase UbiE